MNTIEQIQNAFASFLNQKYNLTPQDIARTQLTLNVDEDKQAFGDLVTNAALIFAKQLGQNPKELATAISKQFTHPLIKTIIVAGPGFINMELASAAFEQLAQELFNRKTAFFKPTKPHDTAINIEFVSANPTGPLHFGHGRGGVIGDVLGNVFSFLRYPVTKEFYINDAGAQIQKLGISLKIRTQQAAGQEVALPDDAYHGDYLIPIAQELLTTYGSAVLEKPDSFFATYAKEALLAQIEKTLDNYGISFDVWFSEKSLHESGVIDAAFKRLKERGYLYEDDGALWFKSTAFGDDKDRVVRKKTGELTYAAPDMAYIQDKISRGHTQLIYILGHDHHSYATRLTTMLKALGLDTHALHVILYQLVKINEGGQQLRMSKRKGNIVTLEDVIDTVGKDVARFFYLNRKADAQLEFDLELALKESDENPVYYIQYAYVRTGSILTNALQEAALAELKPADLHELSIDDQFLIKKIVTLKETLHAIETKLETHLLAYYTHELAQAFNRYYNKNRVINPDNIRLSRARLALITVMRETFGLCLDLMGISKPMRM